MTLEVTSILVAVLSIRLGHTAHGRDPQRTAGALLGGFAVTIAVPVVAVVVVIGALLWSWRCWGCCCADPCTSLGQADVVAWSRWGAWVGCGRCRSCRCGCGCGRC